MGGGSRGGSFRVDSVDRSRAAGLCGRVGVRGGGVLISVIVIEGEDFVPFNGILANSLSFSCLVLFGGRGGRVEGS